MLITGRGASAEARWRGDLTAHGFRVDVPSPETDEDGIAALFVASLGLLLTDSVTLSNVEIFAEPHKGTRGGPSDHRPGQAAASGRLVELSHIIRAGMVTYPGLPGPQITPYLTREASREHYAPDTEFAIDRLTLLGNTGTYLDAPYHRYPGGVDLSGIALARTVDLPAVVVRVTGARQPGIDAGALAALDVARLGGAAAHRRRRAVRLTGLRRKAALPDPGRRSLARRP